MNGNQQFWPAWSQRLHRFGVRDLVSALLEALGPASLLGAQLVYLGQPVLNSFLPKEQTQALAQLLDEPEQALAFAHFLREEPLR